MMKPSEIEMIDRLGLAECYYKNPIVRHALDMVEKGMKLEDALALEKPKDAKFEEDPIDILYKTFNYFQYKDLFADPDNPSHDTKSGQKHGNVELTLARFLPAYHHIRDHLTQYAKPFQGFGVYNKGTDDILKNGYGLCVYYARKDAEGLIELWTRSENEEEKNEIKPEDFIIKEITVSMKERLVVNG